MPARKGFAVFSLVIVSFLLSQSVAAGEWSGSIFFDEQYFLDEGEFRGQAQSYLSMALNPEFHHTWDDGKQLLDFQAFARGGSIDEERNHADIRELMWSYAAPTWELRGGVGKVFWGVTESRHLVDVINQTDLVEGIDGEEKLGQVMLNLAYISDWGTVDGYILPLFRERNYPGPKGRFRYPYEIDQENAQFESAQEQRHVDYALRWTHAVGDWDLGFSYFYGTNREPELIPTIEASGISLVPYYSILSQFGLDAQITLDQWLWKLETIRRSDQDEKYVAATGGFEYTFFDIADSGMDLGWVMEYLFDERGDKASTPFADDVMLGLRLVMNDVQDSTALLGLILDSDDTARMYTLEASRRLGESFTMSLEAFFVSNTENNDPLFLFSNDNNISLSVGYHI